MKKSTIILIVALAILAFAAFVLPPVVGEKNKVYTEEDRMIEITGQNDTISLKQFDNLKITTAGWTTPDFENSPAAKIVMTDSVTHPVIVADKGWAKFFNIDESDGVCCISVVKPEVNDNERIHFDYYFSQGDALCMTILVPMVADGNVALFSVDCANTNLKLNGFRNTSMDISSDRSVKTSDCIFRELSVL